MSDDQPTKDEWYPGHLFRDARERIIKEVLANRERFLQAWIAQTGLHPTDCELVEERYGDGTVRIHVRRREGAVLDKEDLITLVHRTNLRDEDPDLHRKLETELDRLL